jgi:hypothetical protein
VQVLDRGGHLFDHPRHPGGGLARQKLAARVRWPNHLHQVALVQLVKDLKQAIDAEVLVGLVVDNVSLGATA